MHNHILRTIFSDKWKNKQFFQETNSALFWRFYKNKQSDIDLHTQIKHNMDLSANIISLCTATTGYQEQRQEVELASVWRNLSSSGCIRYSKRTTTQVAIANSWQAATTLTGNETKRYVVFKSIRRCGTSKMMMILHWTTTQWLLRGKIVERGLSQFYHFLCYEAISF